MALFDEDQIAQEQRFVEEYMLDFNGARAAAAAGYKGVAAPNLLKRARVQRLIRLKRMELSQATKLEPVWLERQMMAAAAQAVPGSAPHLYALKLLGKRLPGFFEPEQVHVTQLTEEEREEKKRAILEAALQRAKNGE